MDELERSIRRVERELERGDASAARRALDDALARFPDDADLAACEAEVLLEEGRPADALAVLDDLLEPGLDPEEEAWLAWQRALCLDRLGRDGEADAAFAAAARHGHPHPPRMEADAFEQLVLAALEEIPDALRRHLDQVAVAFADYPGPEHDPHLLGVYVGIARPERGHEDRDHLDRIMIFKRNLELAFPDREELVDQVRRTVIHEVAHHFGLDHDAMGPFA